MTIVQRVMIVENGFLVGTLLLLDHGTRVAVQRHRGCQGTATAVVIGIGILHGWMLRL